MASRHWLYFGGFLLSGLLLVAVSLLALLDALSVLSGGTASGEAPLLLAMLGATAEWVVAGVVLALFALLFLVATVVSVLRSTSLHRSDKLVSVVEWLERRYPILEQFDASERVGPTTEDRRRQLKEQYIAGKISDQEFEREMERLLDDDASKTSTRSGADSVVDRETDTRR